MPSSSYLKNQSPYKKYQCRYFDEKGQPLNTPCNQGDRCRFVHPTDSNWPGLRCHPFPTQPNSQKINGQVGSTRAARPGAPLVSQTDLFRLECKVEVEDDMSLLHVPCQRNDNEDYAKRQNNVRKQNRNTDKPNAAIWTTKSRSEWRISSGNQNEFNTKVKSCASDRSSSRDIIRLPVCPGNHLLREKVDATGCATKMADTVRNIANLSNQAVQNSAKHAESERNLNNLNEMSATLSKISASATAAIATPLADTIMDHARNRERMEDNFTALEGEWKRFFETFTTEIIGIIERSVDDAVVNLQREVDDIVQSFRESSSEKRKQGGGSSFSDEDKGYHGSGRENNSSRSRRNRSRSRESKRRRMRSCSPSQTGIRDNEMLPKAFKASFDDILNEIKGKLDQQGDTLQSLQKENHELKQQVREEGGSGSTHTQHADNINRPKGVQQSSSSGWTRYRSGTFETDRRGNCYGNFRS